MMLPRHWKLDGFGRVVLLVALLILATGTWRAAVTGYPAGAVLLGGFAALHVALIWRHW